MKPIEVKVTIKDILPNNYNCRRAPEPFDEQPIYFFTKVYEHGSRGITWWDVKVHNPKKTIFQFRREAEEYWESISNSHPVKESGINREECSNNIISKALEEQQLPVFYSYYPQDIQIGDEIIVKLGKGMKKDGMRGCGSANIVGGHGSGALKLISYHLTTPSLARQFPDHFEILELLHDPIYHHPIKTLKQKADEAPWTFSGYPLNLPLSAITYRWKIKKEDELIQKITEKYKEMRKEIPFSKEEHEILTKRFPQCKSLLDDLY
ncbi:MAG: hypothetical protein PHH54_03985 [Candidatus Nanoarchaeia archaeon]|nr:hypothetical protein [Candidatus Nanoarchaeia archaeon]MDD5741119.1 hypothetical protein [Candidatus Nanoarchaeia archaeon]